MKQVEENEAEKKGQMIGNIELMIGQACIKEVIQSFLSLYIDDVSYHCYHATNK